MSRVIRVFAAAWTVAALVSCGGGQPGDLTPIAEVNEYVISERELRRSLSSSAHLQNIIGLTAEDRKRLLHDQIRKELLIQAAVEDGIDREEEFREAMENYWEQTLIATLVKRQCAKLETDILVSREEIECRCRELVAQGIQTSPSEEHVAAVEGEIREKKKTAALDEWMDGLWKRAKITIHEENLQSLR